MDEGIKASFVEDFTSPVFLLLPPNVAVARLYCDGNREGSMLSLSVSELETVGVSGSGKFRAALGEVGLINHVIPQQGRCESIASLSCTMVPPHDGLQVETLLGSAPLSPSMATSCCWRWTGYDLIVR